MYTSINFKTKKALKDALVEGKRVTCYSPGPFPCPTDGNIVVEGPHYPQPHKWYARATLRDGVVVSVK